MRWIIEIYTCSKAAYKVVGTSAHSPTSHSGARVHIPLSTRMLRFIEHHSPVERTLQNYIKWNPENPGFNYDVLRELETSMTGRVRVVPGLRHPARQQLGPGRRAPAGRGRQRGQQRVVHLRGRPQQVLRRRRGPGEGEPDLGRALAP